MNQNGATSPLPSADTGWAGEISLDVDMVSAICPSCHILLVEAASATAANLYAAVDYAASQARFVSNGWGGDEYSGQTTDDSHFNHPGVAITVSSGDSGNGPSAPLWSALAPGRRWAATGTPAPAEQYPQPSIEHGRYSASTRAKSASSAPPVPPGWSWSAAAATAASPDSSSAQPRQPRPRRHPPAPERSEFRSRVP